MRDTYTQQDAVGQESSDKDLLSNTCKNKVYGTNANNNTNNNGNRIHHQ
jgi:hypothetical protein